MGKISMLLSAMVSSSLKVTGSMASDDFFYTPDAIYRIHPLQGQKGSKDKKTSANKKEDWYAIEIWENRFGKHSQVIDLSDYAPITYYYGLERCKEALKDKKGKQEKELERYK